MTVKRKFKKVIVYFTITLFFIAVAFVSITFTGKSQAGLIEVGCAALLSVIFLHILKRVIPHSSGTIVTILSLLIAIMLLLANFSMQKKKHPHYTFEEFLIGDLLVQRIMGIHKERPDALLAKKLENIIPGEFTQTKTEKSTIESPFEKPEKDLMGTPAFLPLEEPHHVGVRKVNFLAFAIPKEAVNHILKIADSEGFKPGKPRMITELIEDDMDVVSQQTIGDQASFPLHYPSEEFVSLGPLQAIFSPPENEGEMLVSELHEMTAEGYIAEEASKQVVDTLHTP